MKKNAEWFSDNQSASGPSQIGIRHEATSALRSGQYRAGILRESAPSGGPRNGATVQSSADRNRPARWILVAQLKIQTFSCTDSIAIVILNFWTLTPINHDAN